MTKIKFINFIFFLFLFVLIYYEQIAVGPVRISHIWKLLLLVYLIIYILHYYSHKNLPLLILASILVIKFILNNSFPNNLISDLPEAFNFLFLPSFYYFFYKKYFKSPQDLQRIIFLIITFYIVSTIPFYFGILQTPSMHDFTLSRYGFDEDFNALKGLFVHVSISSKVFVVCTLILLFGFIPFVKGVRKIFLLILLILGLIFTYSSFTRLGWFALFFGFFLFYYIENRSNFIFFFRKSFLYLLFLITSFIYLFFNYEPFRYRILGETVYRKFDYINYTAISSGRIDFIPAAFSGIFSNIPSFFIGIGREGSIERMNALTGIAVVAHNQIIDIWQFAGLIGVMLYSIFLINIFKEIKRYSSYNRNSTIIWMLWGLYLLFIFPSHGMPIWVDIIFAAYLALNKILNQQKLNIPYFN